MTAGQQNASPPTARAKQDRARCFNEAATKLSLSARRPGSKRTRHGRALPPASASKREPLLKHPQQPIDDSGLVRHRHAPAAPGDPQRCAPCDAPSWRCSVDRDWPPASSPSCCCCLGLGLAPVRAVCIGGSSAGSSGSTSQPSGRVAERVDGRPVVFVSNHSSWLDIPVLGGRLYACFVAKQRGAGLADHPAPSPVSAAPSMSAAAAPASGASAMTWAGG